MGFAAYLAVDGPEPKAPKHGLLATARLLPESDERWANGVTPWVYPADLPGTHDPCATGSQITTKGVGSALADPTSLSNGAFTVYSPETCTAARIGSFDEYKRRSQVQLLATEQWAVEREFEQGLRVPGNVFLAKAGAQQQAVALDVVQTRLKGLAYLERLIADTGRAGMIHATPEIVTAWSSQGHVFEGADDILYTKAKGTPVVCGSGYQGVAPAGRTPNTGTVQCAYATGEVDFRRSQIISLPTSIEEALNRADNSVVYRSERDYVYDWDATTLRAYVRIDWTT